MPLLVNGYLMRGHVAIIAETESTYVMIESTLWFDDVQYKIYHAFSRFSGWFKGHICGQENGAETAWERG